MPPDCISPQTGPATLLITWRIRLLFSDSIIGELAARLRTAGSRRKLVGQSAREPFQNLGKDCRPAFAVLKVPLRSLAMAFKCTLVTPEQQPFDGSVEQVILPAHDGLIGILTNRAPLLVKLGIGPLRIDQAGEKRLYFLLDGGIAQMRDNNLTVLTREATPATEIDYASAEAEYREALASRPTDDTARQQQEHQIAKARAKQALAARK